MRVRSFVWLLLVLLASPAWAQEQRGSIEGVVADASGAVLPGVTVEARSAEGVSLTATTDGAGIYRFPAVPPGTYTVTATLTGFGPRTVERVAVALGQIKKVDFTLGLAGVTETVQVSVESPIIDIKQAERATHMTAELIERLPKGRDFSSIVTQAPGANNETRLGGLSIDGASAGENRYIIDGAESTDLRTGTQAKNLIVDLIEEIQVKSAGYTAEFGGAMGGVVNVVTKSGTNQFRGDIGTYYSGSALSGDAYLNALGVLVRPTTLRLKPTDSNQAEHFDYKADNYSQVEPGFTLGGPLLRDRIWFFTSYQPQLRSYERTVTFTSNGQTGTYNQTNRQHFSTNNVRFQVGNRTTARVAFNASPEYRTSLLPAIAGSDDPTGDFGVDRAQPNYSYSGNLDFVANNRLFFGIRGGYYYSDVHDKNFYNGTRYLFITSNVGMAGVPQDLQRVTGFNNVTFQMQNITERDRRSRASAQADGTLYMSFGGPHTIKGGVQFDRIANDVFLGETGNLVRVSWDRSLGGQRGPFGFYQVRSNGALPDRGFTTLGDVSVTNLGLFLQDAWTIRDRFTLNLGLRTENETVPSYVTDGGVPSTAIEFDFAQKLAPRVGFAYDVRGDGRWKAYGSWGIFYDIMKLELPRGSFGGDKWLEYYYTLDTPNWPDLDVAGCPPACPGRLFRGPIDFRHISNAPGENTIDPNLDPMRVQKLDFGIEHQLSARVALGARYVRNFVDKAIEDVGALDAQQNEIYKIANPGFGDAAEFAVAGSGQVLPFPKAVRDYDGVEVSIDKRHADNWGLRVSYLWSRLHGNYSGLSQSDENGRTSPNVGRLFDYPLMAFNGRGEPEFGPLGTDRPHQAKAQFTYTAPFGTSLGLYQIVASGIPITRQAAFIPPNNFPIQYAGRGSDGRTGVFSQTDLQLQHGFALKGGHQRILVELNVQNLFDRKTADNVFVTKTAQGLGINVTEEEFYRGIDAEALIAAQQIPTDPRFLKANNFQDARAVRLGVKWSF